MKGLFHKIDELRGLELFAFCQFLTVELGCTNDSASCRHLFVYLDVFRPDLFPIFATVFQLYWEDCIPLAITSGSTTEESQMSKHYIQLVSNRSNMDTMGVLKSFLEQNFNNEIDSDIASTDASISDLYLARSLPTQANLKLALVNIQRFGELWELITNSDNDLKDLVERLHKN